MRYSEIVEARKEPALNPKESVHSYLRKYYNSAEEVTGYDGKEFTNLFISFTKIDKLGINPQSEYNTPLGIYCYPAEHVLEEFSGRQSGDYSDEDIDPSVLPFAGTEPYATFFSVKNSSLRNIVVLDTSESGDLLYHYSQVLARVVEDKFPKIYSKPIRNTIKRQEYMSDEDYAQEVEQAESTIPDNFRYDVEDIVSDAVEHSYHEAKVMTDSGRFWYMFYITAQKIAARTYERAPVIWTKLMLACGIHGVVDPGAGVIHENESTQAVFFSTSVLDIWERVYNKYSSTQLNRGYNTSQISDMTLGAIRQAIENYKNGKIGVSQLMGVASNYKTALREVATAVNPSDYPVVIERLLEGIRGYATISKRELSYIQYFSKNNDILKQILINMDYMYAVTLIKRFFFMKKRSKGDPRVPTRFAPWVAIQLIDAIKDLHNKNQELDAFFSDHEFNNFIPEFKNLILRSDEKTRQLFGANFEND